MKKFLFTLFLLPIAVVLYAQTDRLVTLIGDTLTGKISVSSGRNTHQIINLRNGEDRQRFKVYQVKSVIKGSKYYVPVKVADRYQLGLLVKEGYLSLYKVRDTEETNSTSYSEKVLIKKDGSVLMVPNLAFKKFMSQFLGDCDIVRKGFEKNEYKKSDLNRIIDDYNQCITENSLTIKTEKKETELKETDESSPQNQSKIEKIESLIWHIRQDHTVTNLDDVIDMLHDLKNKISADKEAPSYLINALRSSLNSHKDYLEQLNQVLGQ